MKLHKTLLVISFSLLVLASSLFSNEINIDKKGGIDSYPKGFFDQFDEDLDKLISW